jgi:hypothetical protein
LSNLKIGDTYFDEYGTFIRITKITKDHIAYRIRHKEDLIWDVESEEVESELFFYFIKLLKFRPYTKAARILWGNF